MRQWALKFGQAFADRIRLRLPRAGDKWHLGEVAIKIAGVQHWLWRAVDQNGMVLDVLVQSRRDKRAVKRLLRKLLKRQGRAPRVMITERMWLQSNRRCRNDMSDDQPVLLDDDPVNNEPEDPLLGLERRVDERVPDAVAERLQPL